MKRFRQQTFVHHWVLVTLLTFAAQVVSAGAHMAYMTATMTESAVDKPECHEAHPEMRSAERSMPLHNSGSVCCEGDCSMMGCNTLSVVLYTASFSIEATHSSHAKLASSQPPQKSSNSLFRPPILD